MGGKFGCTGASVARFLGGDDVLGEPNGKTGGDDGVGWTEQVICIYPTPPQMLNVKVCPQVLCCNGNLYFLE